MQNIRWLAFDLDRTIIGPDRILHDHTIQTLRRAADTGYKLILASGRPPRSMRPLIQLIDREIAFVSYNGGYAEAPDGERLCDHRMDASVAARVLDAFRLGDPGSILMECNDQFHYDAYTDFTDKHMKRWPLHPPASVGQMGYAIRSGANKFLAIGSVESITRTEKKLYEFCADQEIIRPTLYPDMEIDFVEVMPRGITKEVGIEAILQRFGWSWRSGIAFGDAINDLSMMEKTEFSVAVEDSCDEALAIATHRCASAKDEGVAFWLDEFLDKMELERQKQQEIA